jgi:hypothetical protein
VGHDDGRLGIEGDAHSYIDSIPHARACQIGIHVAREEFDGKAAAAERIDSA